MGSNGFEFFWNSLHESRVHWASENIEFTKCRNHWSYRHDLINFGIHRDCVISLHFLDWLEAEFGKNSDHSTLKPPPHIKVRYVLVTVLGGSCSFLLLPKCDVTRSNPTRRVPIIKKYNGHHDKSIWFAPKVHFVKNVPRFWNDPICSS